MSGRDITLSDEMMAEAERGTAIKDWIRARADNIRRSVSAHDVLRYYGVKLRGGSDREEQICCPFHGDASPSARVYPSNAKGPSALWCWVCQKRWDVIGLWKTFRSSEEERFTKTLFEIERAFALQVPDGPPKVDLAKAAAAEKAEELDRLYETCETRLRLSKPSFDMRGYYTLGLVLDRLRYRLDNETILAPEAQAIMRKVLDKIGEKERQPNAAKFEDPDAGDGGP